MTPPRKMGPLGLPGLAAEFLLSALYPPRCLGCGKFLSISQGFARLSPERAGPLLGGGDLLALLSGWLCNECQDEVAPVESPICSVCGEVFVSRTGPDRVCGLCAERRPAFSVARAAGLYEGALARGVQRLKYGGRMELARPLGYLLQDAYLRHFADDPPDLVIPVPLHKSRLRERGFNQVMLILADWAGRPELPPVSSRLMKRVRPTPPQASLDRVHRAASVRKAFSVERPDEVKDRKVLVVDDVYTTGATARECAKVLKKAGAARVDVLTLARVTAG